SAGGALHARTINAVINLEGIRRVYEDGAGLASQLAREIASIPGSVFGPDVSACHSISDVERPTSDIDLRCCVGARLGNGLRRVPPGLTSDLRHLTSDFERAAVLTRAPHLRVAENPSRG